MRNGQNQSAGALLRRGIQAYQDRPGLNQLINALVDQGHVPPPAPLLTAKTLAALTGATATKKRLNRRPQSSLPPFYGGFKPPDENNLPVRPTGKKESVRNWRIEMGVQRARSTFSPISDGFLLSSPGVHGVWAGWTSRKPEEIATYLRFSLLAGNVARSKVFVWRTHSPA